MLCDANALFVRIFNLFRARSGQKCRRGHNADAQRLHVSTGRLFNARYRLSTGGRQPKPPLQVLNVANLNEPDLMIYRVCTSPGISREMNSWRVKIQMNYLPSREHAPAVQENK